MQEVEREVNFLKVLSSKEKLITQDIVNMKEQIMVAEVAADKDSNIIANGEVQVVEALEPLVATVDQKEVLVEAAVQDGMILPPQP